MRLTRRQAFLGLLGLSSAASLGAYEVTDDPRSDRTTLTGNERETVLAVADVVFPSDTRPLEPVVTGYVDRLNDDRTRALVATLADLDRTAYDRFGVPFRSLSRADRERLFGALGVPRVQPQRRGTLPARIRFHLVNSVLFAILTHPNGTAPLGIDNPVGYPGGFSSFTQES